MPFVEALGDLAELHGRGCKLVKLRGPAEQTSRGKAANAKAVNAIKVLIGPS